MQQKIIYLKDNYISNSYKLSKTEYLAMFKNSIKNISPIPEPINRQSVKNIFAEDK